MYRGRAVGGYRVCGLGARYAGGVSGVADQINSDQFQLRSRRYQWTCVLVHWVLTSHSSVDTIAAPGVSHHLSTAGGMAL